MYSMMVNALEANIPSTCRERKGLDVISYIKKIIIMYRPPYVGCRIRGKREYYHI